MDCGFSTVQYCNRVLTEYDVANDWRTTGERRLRGATMAALKSWWNKNVAGDGAAAATPAAGATSAGEQKTSTMPQGQPPPPYGGGVGVGVGGVGVGSGGTGRGRNTSPSASAAPSPNRAQSSSSFGSSSGGAPAHDMDKIRAIVKQESERRMAGFRKQMVEVTSQRDRLALQLQESRVELEGLQAVQRSRSQEQSATGRQEQMQVQANRQLREKLEESNLNLAMQLSRTAELEDQAANAIRERDEAKKLAAAMTEMEEDLQKQFSQTVSLNRARIEDLKIC